MATADVMDCVIAAEAACVATIVGYGVKGVCKGAARAIVENVDCLSHAGVLGGSSGDYADKGGGAFV